MLAYFPDAELSCGTAESESCGFFDVFNTPPWDTWVTLLEDTTNPDESYRNCVVSWIPSTLSPLVDAGITVNPEECIAWFDTCRPELHALPKNALSRTEP